MKVSTPLLDKVDQALRRLGPAPTGLVVAVSGGPDSVALLRALVVLRAGPLVIAHLNHQLRGAESDADEAFVRRLFDELTGRGIPELHVRCDRLDVAARLRAEGGNLEGLARRLRYDWLVQIARESGLARVATGHTANDQAETVLHRLLRGTGLKGLRGIAVRRPLAEGVEVVRPLLSVGRDEVLAYLEAERQPYRRDSSNVDPRHTRNRIRRELLPLLEREYNPAVVAALARLAEQAGEAYQQKEIQARALLAEAELPRAGPALVFDRQPLLSVPRYLVREMFRLAWEREGWPQGDMGFDDWDRLAGVIFGERPAVTLPGRVRVRVRRRGRVVQIGPAL